MPAELTRRAFLMGLSGGAAGLSLGVRFAGARPILTRDLAPNPFVHIDGQGLVTIVCHRSEMGQGIRGSLPVLLADELGADWSRVRLVQAEGDARYGSQNTDGSKSVRLFYEGMRLAGAAARTMLVAAAARRWRVPAAGLVARDHVVREDRPGGRSLGFGELVADAAALPVPNPKSLVLRRDDDLRPAGRPFPLVDAPDQVRGRAVYGADVRLPGMLTAVIARPPVVGGRAVRVDDDAALAVAGVRQVLRMPAWKAPAKFQPLGGVAVVADHTWAALRGRAALAIEWEAGEHGAYDSSAYKDALRQAVNAPGEVVRQRGDAGQALAGAARTIAAEYHVPHLAHAPMEPPVAVARVDAAGCEVWAPTQDPQRARAEVAAALGLDEARVTVHVTLLGGGFGRKAKPDYVVEAAVLAREMGVPVRVQWTREDDLRHGYVHAVSGQRLEAGIDGQGKVIAWRHRIASPPIAWTFDGTSERVTAGDLSQGILDLPLAIPHVRVEACRAPAHARIGWMRSVYNINHAFAVQSFIDELATALRRDPRDLLLEILGPARQLTLAEAGIQSSPNYGASLKEHPVDVGRLRRVLEAVTDRARWDQERRAGRALGLAVHRSFLSYAAVVAAVSRDPRGRIQVEEVWMTADVGRVLNPDRVQAQLEGAVVFGMGVALHGAITMRRGAVEQANFRDYRLVRMGEVPRRIHIEVLSSTQPPAGVGEPGVPPVAPAIANAAFALTGTRFRELPLRGGA